MVEWVLSRSCLKRRGHSGPGDARGGGHGVVREAGGGEFYMQRLELTREQQEVLRDMVKHAVADMGLEVLHTDSHDFKEMLRHRLKIMEQIAAKLELPISAESLSV